MSSSVLSEPCRRAVRRCRARWPTISAGAPRGGADADVSDEGALDPATRSADSGYQMEWRVRVGETVNWRRKASARCWKPSAALEGAIDDGALADLVGAIWPAQGDVHHRVEGPEGLSRIWAAPRPRVRPEAGMIGLMR